MKKIKKQNPVRPETSETPELQISMPFGMNGLVRNAGWQKKVKNKDQ